MISTIEAKAEQLANGYYQNGSGKEHILIVGSCRTIAYLNYLMRWNNSHGGNRFTIRRIDPCDWAIEKISLSGFESDNRILSVLRSTTIFIHEHLVNYGMFNTDRSVEKSIYDFGMNPPIDISIPNFNDHLILENDWIAYGATTPENYVELGNAQIEKFVSHCEKSSFPEFAQIFRDNWRTKRFFWRPNHTSAAFTTAIFRLMNDKYLHLDLGDNFWEGADQEDLYKDPHTEVTSKDRENYGITW